MLYLCTLVLVMLKCACQTHSKHLLDCVLGARLVRPNRAVAGHFTRIPLLYSSVAEGPSTAEDIHSAFHTFFTCLARVRSTVCTSSSNQLHVGSVVGCVRVRVARTKQCERYTVHNKKSL